MDNATPLAGELFVTHFLVVSDQDRSRDFYQSVFGAEVLRERGPNQARFRRPAWLTPPLRGLLSLSRPPCRPYGKPDGSGPPFGLKPAIHQ